MNPRNLSVVIDQMLAIIPQSEEWLIGALDGPGAFIDLIVTKNF